MSEMVNKVAQAIADVWCEKPGNTEAARLFEKTARAAIEAMNGKYDLPLAMKSAGARVLQEKAPDGGEPLATAHRCWQAMIDQALK